MERVEEIRERLRQAVERREAALRKATSCRLAEQRAKNQLSDCQGQYDSIIARLRQEERAHARALAAWTRGERTEKPIFRQDNTGELNEIKRALAAAQDAHAQLVSESQAVMNAYALTISAAEDLALNVLAATADDLAEQMETARSRVVELYDRIVALTSLQVAGTAAQHGVMLSKCAREALAKASALTQRFPPQADAARAPYLAEWRTMYTAILKEPTIDADKVHEEAA